MIEGDAIAGVKGEMNALVGSLVSQDFVGEAEVNKRESVGVYKGSPKSWQPLGEVDQKPVEPVPKPVEPVFQKAVHSFLADTADWQKKMNSAKTGWTYFKTG